MGARAGEVAGVPHGRQSERRAKAESMRGDGPEMRSREMGCPCSDGRGTEDRVCSECRGWEGREQGTGARCMSAGCGGRGRRLRGKAKVGERGRGPVPDSSQESCAERLHRRAEETVTRREAEQLGTVAHVFKARCSCVSSRDALRVSMIKSVSEVGKAVPREGKETHQIHALVGRAHRAMGVPGAPGEGAVSLSEQTRALMRVIGGDLPRWGPEGEEEKRVKQVTAAVVAAVVGVQMVAALMLREYREATSVARRARVDRERGREWARLVMRAWREVADGRAAQGRTGGRMRWRVVPVSAQVTLREGNCIWALLEYTRLVQSVRWCRSRQRWRMLKGQVPRVIQAERIAGEEAERQRAERQERERREALAGQRGVGGLAARTRGMGQAGVERESGWESVLSRIRGGEEEMRERVNRACLRAVEVRRMRRGGRHGARRGTTTAAVSASALEQMCARAGVSMWRREQMQMAMDTEPD